MKKFAAVQKINLSLFDEGSGAAGTGTAAAAAGTGVGTPQETTGAPKVIYGKQPETANDNPAAGGTATQQVADQAKQLEELRAEFETLTKGKFKDLYNESVSQIVQKRLKGTKLEQQQTEERFQQANQVLDILAAKYNVKPGDYEGLQRAFNSDSAYWELAAEEAGMSLEQYRYVTYLQQQNAYNQRTQEQLRAQAEAEKTYNGWVEEAKTLQQKYPEFNLETEITNPEFKRLLRANIPVEQAYNLIHMDEITNNLQKQTAKQTEQNITESIRTNGQRPNEAGVKQHPGVIIKSDPTQLTAEDRAAIAERVKAGEQIIF